MDERRLGREVKVMAGGDFIISIGRSTDLRRRYRSRQDLTGTHQRVARDFGGGGEGGNDGFSGGRED